MRTVDPQPYTTRVFRLAPRREGRIPSLLSRRHRVWFCGSLLSHTWTRRALVGAILRSPPTIAHPELDESPHLHSILMMGFARATAPPATMTTIPNTQTTAYLIKTMADPDEVL